MQLIALCSGSGFVCAHLHTILRVGLRRDMRRRGIVVGVHEHGNLPGLDHEEVPGGLSLFDDALFRFKLLEAASKDSRKTLLRPPAAARVGGSVGGRNHSNPL